jgi:dTDP-4-amino-4,6-dideoxygalactose transaminase
MFEEKVAAYVGVSDAVACQSGTAGLHVALRLLGVGAGDEVIAPTLTFIAAVNPIRYLGAEPVFMDCDDSLCLDPVKLERFCREECHLEDGNLINNDTDRIVKAVVPVHVFGNLADMEAIADTAARYGLKVLEDATEAMGSFFAQGRYAGRHAGTVGDLGVFSFNANKIITTGGGGMIVAGESPSAESYTRQARYLTTTARDDEFFFVHDAVGYNYRMLNIQAALGVSQIDELEDFVAIKRNNFAVYEECLRDAPQMRLLPFREGIRANKGCYSLLIEDEIESPHISGADGYSDATQCDVRDARGISMSDPAGNRRDRLMKSMIAEGIQCRPVWKLIHTQKPYAEARAYDIDKARYYEKHVMNIPCSTSLTEDDVRFVCDSIMKFSRSL